MATEPALVLDLGLNPGDRVAVIGAGGTTRLLSRLALEWGSAGGRPWITATTRLDTRELDGAVAVLRLPSEETGQESLLLGHPLRGQAGQAVAVGLADPGGERRAYRLGPLRDRAGEQLAVLWGADLQLVKADGTRGQPFKAHAEHEPEIPQRSTRVVAVVGLWVLGRPLVEDEVHRAELACELWGYAPGEPVDEDLLARALLEPEGYRRAVPSGAGYSVFLNHRGEPRLAAAAKRLEQRLQAGGCPVIAGDLRAAGPAS